MIFNDAYFKSLSFIKSANIMLKEQFDLFCENIGISDSQKGNVLKMLITKRELFVDPSKKFYSSSEDVTYKNLTPALEKTIWFYVENCDKYSYCNFNPKPPSSAYMSTTEGEFEDLSVFYIPEGTEKLQSRIIETNYGGMPSSVPTALICSSPDSLSDVFLSEVFDLKRIVLIDNSGSIQELL